MTARSVLVKVPATVGNFAGAMNCAALALDAMLNVKVTPRADGHVGIRYFGENGDRVPRDRANLAVRAMEAALHLKGYEFSGADFEIYSSVPVGLGLGSSTAAVLAGLMAADRLYSLRFDEKTLFDLAHIYETRSDNLLAAWHGGFVACADEPSSAVRRTHVHGDFLLSVIAPEGPIAPASIAGKSQKRGMQPGVDPSVHLRRAQTVAEFLMQPAKSPALDFNSSLPPTCRKIVAGLEESLKVCTDGALSVFVCGSGPAVGILTQQNPENAIEAVRRRFRDFGVSSTFGTFRPANLGARDWNAVRSHISLPSVRPFQTPAGSAA